MAEKIPWSTPIPCDIGPGWTRMTKPRANGPPGSRVADHTWIGPDGKKYRSEKQARAAAANPAAASAVPAAGGKPKKAAAKKPPTTLKPEGNAILLCDGFGCTSAFHQRCLPTPLEEVPDGDWLCPKCAPEAPTADLVMPSP
ncbi:hypothetical protein EMIHUDRAFT_259303, partial [Emiliania huxleyi CCMP1516]|uniref:Zinc finger PHD-type domain-containing protein n=2 Tax=Emiliania huxleyi TaxID=2903 RepID=A0A0D3I2N2_EMIH1